MLLINNNVNNVNDNNDVNDVNDVNDANDAKANDDQSRKKKDHVLILVLIKSSDS
jgi:hypothetical protein